jgi:preprotein translocase subunit SecE
MKSRSPAALKKGGSRRSPLRLFPEILSELKKVVWPSREETRHLTIIVLIVATAVGLLLGILDLGFAELFDSLFLR